jgi:hypothetical protein
MISANTLATLVRNKDHFYKAMKVNGYFIPSKGSQLCTLKFLKAIYHDECHGVLTEDISFKYCAMPPDAETLIGILQDYVDTRDDWDSAVEVERLDCLLRYLRHSPDKDFMIGLISHLVPDSEIFRKSYRPPIPEKPLAQS